MPCQCGSRWWSCLSPALGQNNHVKSLLSSQDCTVLAKVKAVIKSTCLFSKSQNQCYHNYHWQVSRTASYHSDISRLGQWKPLLNDAANEVADRKSRSMNTALSIAILILKAASELDWQCQRIGTPTANDMDIVTSWRHQLSVTWSPTVGLGFDPQCSRLILKLLPKTSTANTIPANKQVASKAMTVIPIILNVLGCCKKKLS